MGFGVIQTYVQSQPFHLLLGQSYTIYLTFSFFKSEFVYLNCKAYTSDRVFGRLIMRVNHLMHGRHSKGSSY